jgi:hypothetical protein
LQLKVAKGIMAAVEIHQDALSTTVGSSDSEDNLSPRDVITSCQAKIGKVDDAVKQYGKHFGQQVAGKDLFAVGESLPWNSDGDRQCLDSYADVKAAFMEEVEKVVARETQAKVCPPAPAERRKHYRFKDIASNIDFKEEDSDGEILDICQKCSLPLGKIRYRPDDEACVGLGFHSECMAQVSVARLQKEEAEKKELDRKEKQEHREAYSIGWNVKHIPRNTTAASKLAMQEVPQGMMCLVLDEDANSVRMASTLLPSAAVNLEYLSVALQVRRKEGHEPVFSLDPVDPEQECDENSMQAKVFVPEWLAGTPVGEVLFQADYHLKELSMGEHGQPVVGMRSCFDLSDVEFPRAWAAREWFMVRKAEMQITGGNALVPYVKMGVEAREQVVNGNSLVDKNISLPDHPMVKFAESFTRNFDLIAERRSVIYHLRELAKASVIAKFLLDSKIRLEESWFHLSVIKDITCSMEVPQLWNHRVRGKVLESGKTQTTKAHTHSVYGGVNFGLNKFTLSGRLQRAPSITAQAGLTTGRSSATPAKHFTPRAALGASLSASALTRGRLSGSLAMPSLSQASAPVSLSGAIVPASIQPGVAIPELRGTSALSKLSGLLPSPGVVPPQGLVPAKGILPKGFLTVGVPSGLVRGASPSSALTSYIPSGSPPGMRDLVSPRMPTFSPPSASVSAVSAPRLAPGALSAALASPRLSAQLSPPVFAAGAMPIIQGIASFPGPEGLQAVKPEGVDLRLDNFDLSHAMRLPDEAHGSLGSDVKPLDENVAIGDTFWSSLEDDANKLFSMQDRDLLRKIFNPALSDRRAEGELFCPPDVSHSYVSKLRALVKEEECLRQRRKDAFLSVDFTTSNPGELFPASWTPAVTALADGDVPVRSLDTHHVLTARPEFKDFAAELLETTARKAVPIFDRATEEESRFRIYHFGSLEVRTVQESTSPEIVGAVFSIRRQSVSLKQEASRSQQETIPDTEKIVKATHYVEHIFDANGKASSRRHYYLVVETENGQKISTERLRDGAVTWDENPAGLEDRSSLARAIEIADCKPGAVVKDLKSYQAVVAGGAAESGSASPSFCKRYARTAFARIAAAESRRSGEPLAWVKMAQESAEATCREEKKVPAFVALPRTMLKKR